MSHMCHKIISQVKVLKAQMTPDLSKSGVVTAIKIITHPTNLFGSEDSWRPSLTDSKDFTDKIFTESTQIYAELQRAPITQIVQFFIQPSFFA